MSIFSLLETFIIQNKARILKFGCQNLGIFSIFMLQNKRKTIRFPELMSDDSFS